MRNVNSDNRLCELCLSFETGPRRERAKPYGRGEGLTTGLHRWTPYARVVVLEDGWNAVWESAEQPQPDLTCPEHASNERVLRPAALTMIGNVTINLQEFDYILTRPLDIVMFKHIATRRYLSLAQRDDRVVWCEYVSGHGTIERDVNDGFRFARAQAT